MVITVSPPLSEALQRHYRLAKPPVVVLNIPPVGARHLDTPSVREVIGLAAEVPLLVYSGGVQQARGVQTAIAALPLMPEAQLAIVAVPSKNTVAVERLLQQAANLGVADRVHALDPVAPHHVAAFLSSADVGLIPLRHYGSHEMALANKLFEYLHAEIPVVVSDCKAQREFVEATGIGEVHIADDATDLARAVNEVLANREQYGRALRSEGLLEQYTWQRQAEILQSAYRLLLDESDGWSPHVDVDVAEPDEMPWSARSGSTQTALLGIGPANSAGQAWAWATAAERFLPDVTHDVIAIQNGVLDYPCDHAISKAGYAKDGRWAITARERALSQWSHALMEAGRPIFGLLEGKDFRGDLALLRSAGVEVGLVFHGSEIRDPRKHAANHRFSPFADPTDPLTLRLQQHTDRLLPLIGEFDGPTFVSTPDQLDYVPGATWLPVVVDTRSFPYAGSGSRGGGSAPRSRAEQSVA